MNSSEIVSPIPHKQIWLWNADRISKGFGCASTGKVLQIILIFSRRHTGLVAGASKISKQRWRKILNMLFLLKWESLSQESGTEPRFFQGQSGMCVYITVAHGSSLGSGASFSHYATVMFSKFGETCSQLRLKKSFGRVMKQFSHWKLNPDG